MMSTPSRAAQRRNATQPSSPLRGALVAVATASVLALAGCVPVVAGGPMTTEEREIGDVSAVELDTSGNLTITEGEPSLVISAPSEALDRLTADTDGSTLRLGTTPGTEVVLGEVRYELTVSDLSEITVNGSGDVESTVSSDAGILVDVDGSGDVSWTGLDADDVTVRVAGSGDVELSGTTAALTIQLDGSGDIDVGDLEARDAVVTIAGSGNVQVTALDTLSAEVTGSGTVTYTGDPEVDSEVSGSGDVVPEG
jgi:hypothetical protein